ncbi:MAG: prepilin-type N-terminal cleavage/methylation domain-containing protein [Pseudomonadota bacterium]
MIRRLRRTHRSRGFTLIESLVAVVVATTALAGFYSAMSTGLQLGKRADQQARYVSVATMILDRVGPDYPLNPGLTENGQLDGLDWTLTISDRPTSDIALGVADPDMLAFIYVQVADPDTGEAAVTLRGIRYLETPL